MSFWLPRTGCGAHCVTVPARVSRLRRAGRLAALAAVVASGGLVLPLLPVRHRSAGLRGFARAALRALGVRVTVRGQLPARRALVVANHVSWLDILVLLAAGGCRLVAKAEVRGWPVIGKVAASTGTVFIDRVRPRTLPATVAAVRDALASGAVVAVFPEGTTSCGQLIGPFRPALFQAALAAGVPVVPARLRFTVGPAGQPATLAAFIGEESLVSSVRRVLAAQRLRVDVLAGAAIHADAGADRRVLARLAAYAVDAEWPARLPAHPVLCGAAPATPPTPARATVAAPRRTGRVPRLTLLEGWSGGDDQRTAAAPPAPAGAPAGVPVAASTGVPAAAPGTLPSTAPGTAPADAALSPAA